MTCGVDDGHLFFIFRSDEGVVHIQNEVDNVQWQPSDGENEGDCYQQAVPPPQPLRKLRYSERIILLSTARNFCLIGFISTMKKVVYVHE